MGRVLPAFELNSIQIADADGINVIPKFNQHYKERNCFAALQLRTRANRHASIAVDCTE